MADEEKKKLYSLPQSDLDKKWDACIDLSIRRVLYSSVAGAFSGLIFFRNHPANLFFKFTPLDFS
jgi:MICOS complex subunit MIC10